MTVHFEENEYMLMAMFQKGSRQETIEVIRGVIPFTAEDEEISALIRDTLGKMENIYDEMFLGLDLEIYKEDAMEGDGAWT